MSSIRKGNTQIPPQFEEELLEMGLDLRNRRLWSGTGSGKKNICPPSAIFTGTRVISMRLALTPFLDIS